MGKHKEHKEHASQPSSAHPVLVGIIVILLLLCAVLGYLLLQKQNDSATSPEVTVQPQLGPNQYIPLADIPKPPRVDDNPKETLQVLLTETEKIREVKREIPTIFSQLRPYTENNKFIWIVDPTGDKERIEAYKGIQSALKLIGCYGGTVDGNWQSTEKAVIAFQSEYGIANDGYFGRNTLGKICTIYLDQISKEK